MREIAVLSTRSTRDYAQEVRAALARTGAGLAEPQAEISVQRFANGEIEVRIDESVRGKDAYLFASSARNRLGLGSEESKLELYHAVDALKRAKAERVTVFEPYVSCSRSDRATGRGSVGLWVHFKILASLGVDQIITFQLHSDKSKTMVDPVIARFDDVPAARLLEKSLCDLYIRDAQDLRERIRKEWIFCSVDSGGEKIATRFARCFGTGLIVGHKERDYSKANTVESISLLSSGDVKGKIAWIVDDMIDTAASVGVMARILAERGLKEVNVATVHAVLSDPALERLSALHAEGILGSFLITDSIPLDDRLKKGLPFTKVVGSSSLAAEMIKALATDDSISGFFDEFDPEAYLSRD
jgi:ribose-phosphate pyrophosphokinase